LPGWPTSPQAPDAMLDSLLRVSNLGWHSRGPRPPGYLGVENAQCEAYDDLTGRFAVAQRVGDQVILARDALGLNKIFFAIHEQHGVLVANYLVDLVARGVPFEAIYAVPAGTVIEIALRQREFRSRKFHTLSSRHVSNLHATLADVRCALDNYFGILCQQFPRALITVCLSGGLDSALVASVAREHFPAIIAYTYSYTDGGTRSEDARLAQQTANHLRIPHRLVEAGPADVLNALRDAVRFGQDWRDFNAHCAIVNVLLADAIARDTRAISDASEILVLTGDLMNELLADYAPVRYRGRDYYTLPAIGPDALRRALVRGIQVGDREVGVFQSRGLTTVQPYGAVFRNLLALPSAIEKPDVIRALAGDRLPTVFYERRKARAQIGDTEVRTGVLPLLVDSGRDDEWLERLACELFGAPDQWSLRNLIRAGMYRPCLRFPERRCERSGYLTI
jgi:asparagine synthetase B (glutamine-hydrolysing)